MIPLGTPPSATRRRGFFFDRPATGSFNAELSVAVTKGKQVTGAKRVYRPLWVMAMLGLLGLLASLAPAAFSVVTDWHETRGQAQRGVDAMADGVAQDVAQSLERNAAVLSRLSRLLQESERPSPVALAELLPPGYPGWVGVHGRGGERLFATATSVPQHLPDRPLSFIRQNGGMVLAVLAEPAPGDGRVMVAAVPLSALRSGSAFMITIEDETGEVMLRDPAIMLGSVDIPVAETMVSRRLVPGQALTVVVAQQTRFAMLGWQARAWRSGLAALLTALVVVPVLLVCGKRLVRDNQASAALEAANRELSRSNADLEQFAYVASHDLKEPLRNIASYVQLLQRRYQGKLDEDADAFIGYTVEGVRRMQVIINELLAYSRIGTGPLTTAPVQTGVLVSAVLGNLKAAISEAGAVVDVAGPLPVVMGDSGQLASVFQNLLANALKYRRDDVRPEVKVAVSDMGGLWRFSIADNGIGIDPAYQQQIFELFKRLHSRDRYTGSGIGLAVCQRVVERHGGAIWVESIPGQGACFHFTLPKMGA